MSFEQPEEQGADADSGCAGLIKPIGWGYPERFVEDDLDITAQQVVFTGVG